MGWKCKCGEKMLTLQTRTSGAGISRRHQCTVCGLRCTTVELLADEYNRAIAHNGTVIDQHARAISLHAGLREVAKKFIADLQELVK